MIKKVKLEYCWCAMLLMEHVIVRITKYVNYYNGE